MVKLVNFPISTVFLSTVLFVVEQKNDAFNRVGGRLDILKLIV